MVVKLNFKDYALLRQNLEEVEDALAEQLLPSKQLKSLNAKVDQSLLLLSSLRQEDDHLGEETLSALEDHMIILYGIIHNRYFDSELLSMIEQTKELNQHLKKSALTKVNQSIDDLKKGIARYKKDFRPDLKQKKILYLLDQFLFHFNKGSESIESLIQQMEQIFLFFDLSTLSQEQADFIIDLFEVLDLMERKQSKEATQKLFRLCPELAKNHDKIKEEQVWEKIFQVAGLTKTERLELVTHKQAIN